MPKELNRDGKPMPKGRKSAFGSAVSVKRNGGVRSRNQVVDHGAKSRELGAPDQAPGVPVSVEDQAQGAGTSNPRHWRKFKQSRLGKIDTTGWTWQDLGLSPRQPPPATGQTGPLGRLAEYEGMTRWLSRPENHAAMCIALANGVTLKRIAEICQVHYINVITALYTDRAAYQRAMAARSHIDMIRMDMDIEDVRKGKLPADAGRVILNAQQWMAAARNPTEFGNRQNIALQAQVDVRVDKQAGDNLMKKLTGLMDAPVLPTPPPSTEPAKD